MFAIVQRESKKNWTGTFSMHGTRNNYLHDVKAVANAMMRIQNNLKSIQQDISFINSQMDKIHKDVFHHLPVSEESHDKKI
jgi:hypothetical protein